MSGKIEDRRDKYNDQIKQIDEQLGACQKRKVAKTQVLAGEDKSVWVFYEAYDFVAEAKIEALGKKLKLKREGSGGGFQSSKRDISFGLGGNPKEKILKAFRKLKDVTARIY